MKRKTHQPCHDCGSSDALTVYEDGHTYCFSCKTTRKDLTSETRCDIISLYIPKRDYNTTITTNYYNSSKKEIEESRKDKIIDMMIGKEEERYKSYKGISEATMKFFGALSPAEGPASIIYPYGGEAWKVRYLEKKDFRTVGNWSKALPLWGMDRFSPGSGKTITITEGENDAMAVLEMMGKYPVVSVHSSGSAVKNCKEAYDYINSFEKIVLCFDNDKPGIDARNQVASLFDVNKVVIVEFGSGLKDAHDYLQQGKAKEFSNLWWQAKKHRPKGIVESFADVKKILSSANEPPVATYPFPTLDDMAYSIRLGEVILFTALEKIGKTEIIRAIEHHLVKTTDYPVGIIHLEEGEKRSIQGLLSYEFKTPVHLPDCMYTPDDQAAMYEKMVGKEGRLHFYTHFGSDDPNTILDVIRYMVTVCGCKFIFFDHITMLVTGFEGDDERKKLDYISTRLAMMTRELNFTLFLVSHVNDNGQTRGSRNISKIADLIIHLDRNPEAPDYDTRNTTNLMVKGNRFGAKSGPAGHLFFDVSSFTVREKTLEDSANGEVPF